MALKEIVVDDDGSVDRDRGYDLSNLMRQRYTTYKGWHDEPAAHIEQNQPFKALLRFDSFHSTNNSYWVEWVNADTGARYPMFFSEFSNIVDKMQNGFVAGTWQFHKHGSCVGIKRVAE